MADTKKAISDMKKLELGKDSKTDASKKSPTTPNSLSPTSPTGPAGAGGAGVVRSPSAIKETMLAWCKSVTEGYEHVNITNFSSSWADGMAFCALIHHFYPNAFDYSKLKPKNRRGNFKLAFDVAEKLADVSPLLDVEDMILMKDKPDWKCVFVYVQSLYRRLVIQAKQQQKKDGEAGDDKEKKDDVGDAKCAEDTDDKEKKADDKSDAKSD